MKGALETALCRSAVTFACAPGAGDGFPNYRRRRMRCGISAAGGIEIAFEQAGLAEIRQEPPEQPICIGAFSKS